MLLKLLKALLKGGSQSQSCLEGLFTLLNHIMSEIAMHAMKNKNSCGCAYGAIFANQELGNH
uniref:Uncharacterized protein n=1 Tax=Anguilla anguilla TaxID=7936 RepID=A0A0E9TD67_ANGAN